MAQTGPTFSRWSLFGPATYTYESRTLAPRSSREYLLKGLVRCVHWGMVDGQVGRIIESMVLPDDWLEAALERISLTDEVARFRIEREQFQEKLKRLGRAFVDGLVDEAHYERQEAQ